MTLSSRVLAVFALLLGSLPAQADLITNGDFAVSGVSPDPFLGWSTFEPDFANARPTNGGGWAVFTESDQISCVQLEQSFDLPANIRSLRFEYRLVVAPNGFGGSPIPDSFQATLYNPGLLSSIAPSDPQLPDLFPAFFSVDASSIGAGQEFRDQSVVGIAPTTDGWRQVTLDLTGIGERPNVLLEFRLNGSDNGSLTTTQVRDVQTEVTQIPAPGALPLLAVVAVCLLARRVSTALNGGKVCRTG